MRLGPEKDKKEPEDSDQSGTRLGFGPWGRVYLDPKRTYLFRVPYYDFFIYVLKKVGYLGLR